MRILYFYQFFSTPKGSWGTRVYEFAKEWVEKGHEVTVVTSVFVKSDLKAEKLIETQYFDDIKVKVINITMDNRQSILKRIWTFMAYAFLSCWYALTLKADVVVASSGPITVGLPGLVARYLRGRKLVFEVRDLWPEGAIELGVIKNPIIKSLSLWFEKTCYRASEHVICLSPGMKTHIETKHIGVKATSVTNAANVELFSTSQPFPKDEKALQPKKYAIYTGNIGEVNNSYWLYNAAVKLKKLGRNDIKIVLVGEGQQRIELQELAKQNGIDNFIHKGLMPKEDLIPYIQHAMVSMVPLKGTPVLDTSSPNKLFESIAAGIPVIQNTQGWIKDFLEEHKIGYTLNPNDPLQLAEKLIWVDENPEEMKSMGEVAAEVAKKNFDKTYLADKMLNCLESVANGKK